MRRTARYLSLFGPLLVVLAMSKVHARWIADPPYDYTGSFRFAWSLAYSMALAVAAYGMGLPELVHGRRQVISRAASASACAALGISVVQLAMGDALLPRFVVFGAAILVVPIQVAAVVLARRGQRTDEGRDRVVLVGSGDEHGRLVADLALAPERAAVLVAHLTVAEAASGGDQRSLVEKVLETRASVIVLDRDAQSSDGVVTDAAVLHEAGVRVRSLVQFYEEWLGKLPIGELERASLFFDISEIHRVRYARVKRLMDVVMGVAGMVPFVLSIPLVWIVNTFSNRGPLFYRQERVGRNGVPFDILKFRSMLPHAGGSDERSSDWTQVDDPRITSFGKVLRASHLDELPQVLNVVRGELSVVGPRPEQPRYVKELSASLPFYGMRHLVRPGITGWAQVKYGYAGDERDAIEKLQYEFFYLRHQGVQFDLRVIGRTVRSVTGTGGGGR